MTAAAAGRLARLAASLREQRPVPIEDAEPLADALDAFLAGDVDRLDVALGLCARGKDWRGELATQRRNEFLREAARLFGPPAGEGRAAWLRKTLDNYRTSAWRHDRMKASPPQHALKAKLWFALRQCDRDLKLSALKQILKDTEIG